MTSTQVFGLEGVVVMVGVGVVSSFWVAVLLFSTGKGVFFSVVATTYVT